MRHNEVTSYLFHAHTLIVRPVFVALCVIALLGSASIGTASSQPLDGPPDDYAPYVLPSGPEAYLDSLELSGIDFGEFDPEVTEYEVSVPHDVTRTTITTETASPASKTDVLIVPSDADPNAHGHQIDLKVGKTPIFVNVVFFDFTIGPSSSRDTTYKVNVTRRAAPVLDSLALGDVYFGEFDSATAAYSAQVPHTVTTTTVEATADTDYGVVSIEPADADLDTEGYQVSLGDGDTTITVTVTDGETVNSYTVVVTSILSVTIPDLNLRTVIEDELGKDTGDIITPDDMQALTDLSARGADIADLTGLEYATNLTNLDLSEWHRFTSIDLTPFTGLVRLNVSGNFELTSITGLSGLTNLVSLSADSARLTSIDVTGLSSLQELHLNNNRTLGPITGLNTLTALSILDLNGANQASLDVSKLANLKWLDVAQNYDLATLDLSNNTGLTDLHFSETSISTIDLSSNTKLENLYTFVSIYGGGPLTSLDVSNNIALKNLGVNGSTLTSLDLSNNVELEHLQLADNELISLDLSNNVNLSSIRAPRNELVSVDLPGSSTLTQVTLFDNEIESIDITGIPNLTQLSMCGNNLTSIDVSNNPELAYLYLRLNNLTSIDVSNNPELVRLDVMHNQITSIDVSANLKLEGLSVWGNDMTDNDITGHRNDNGSFRNDMYFFNGAGEWVWAPDWLIEEANSQYDSCGPWGNGAAR